MPLTSEQLAIVQSPETYVNVRAVPGCGKTHIAIACIKRWIESGTPETNILGLSFSNTTVDDFKERLAIPDVCVRTVHAIGLALQGTKKAVLSSSESEELLGEAMQQLIDSLTLSSGRFSARPKRRAKALQSLLPHIVPLNAAISHARARCMSLTSFLKTSTGFDVLKSHAKLLELVVKRYQTVKIKLDLVDFSDMVDENVSSVMAKGFCWTHVIIDEAQDCTEAQARMIAALCKRTKLQAFRSFGDPMQAIYEFAGAGGVDFAELLDCHTMALTVTRRLTRPIAALATCIAGKSGQTISASRNGLRPTLIRCEWNELGVDVFRQIRRHHKNDPMATVAILARTRAQIRVIDQALRAQGIWAVSPNSELVAKDLRQVLKACHYFGTKKKPSRNTADSLTTCLTYLRGESEGTVNRTVQNYLLQAWGSCNLESRLGLVIKAYTALQPSDERKALRNELRLWLPLARQHESALAMWQHLRTTRERRVTLGTIHSAKGREWDHVMVLGVTEGLLPIHFAMDDKKKLEDEQRVLYVAVTRAKATVRLYHTPARHPYTRALLCEESRYLAGTEKVLNRRELKWCGTR